MSYAALLIDSVTIYPVTESDDFTPADTVGTGVTYPARVFQLAADELLVDRDTRHTQFGVQIGPDAVVTATSVVDWNGDRYQVVGEPAEAKDATGVHNLVFQMERFEG